MIAALAFTVWFALPNAPSGAPGEAPIEAEAATESEAFQVPKGSERSAWTREARTLTEERVAFASGGEEVWNLVIP